MDARLAIGLSFDSETGDASAALVRVHGVGLDCQVETLSWWGGTLRACGSPPSGLSEIAQQFYDAVSLLIQRAALALDQVLLVSLAVSDQTILTEKSATLAARLADLSNTTTVACISGHAPTLNFTDKSLLADWILAHDSARSRLVIHLDRVTRVSRLPADSGPAAGRSFDTGPGVALLESLLAVLAPSHTPEDQRGLLAVQGRQIKPLIRRWASHPFLRQDAARSLKPEDFAGPFLDETVQLAVERGWPLTDVLCTATHFIAACPADALRRFPATTPLPDQVVVVGRGAQNGFLLRLIEEQFAELGVQTVSLPNITTIAYDALVAAVLGCLTLDVVTPDPSFLSGHPGRRLLGHLVPGSPRNWRRCIEWMYHAAQMGDSRAA